jgi:hypothetical protein
METAIIYHLNVGKMGISLLNGNCHPLISEIPILPTFK